MRMDRNVNYRIQSWMGCIMEVWVLIRLGLAKRVGADLALRIQVDQFRSEEKSGYTSEEVEDSQLAEEMGTDGKTQRTVRVKALEGQVVDG
ncbi:MAG: hypothetical protein RLZZ69_406, partial [Cyanobacteriota bacterium]